MQRFKNILFSPLAQDGNQAALRRVTQMYGTNGAQLTLFAAVAEPSRLQRLLHRAGHVDQMMSAERNRLSQNLQRWANASPITAALSVEVGDPALRIIEHVLRGDFDLVVVTSDENKEDRSTIRRLLRKCPCPVWVIRPSRARTQRVLATVNPDPDEAGLNRTILELAASMVNLEGGELHVVHAWELYGEATMRSSGFMDVSEAELDAMLEEERVKHETALADLLASVSVADKPWRVHVVKGAADVVVPATVIENAISLLVMGTVGRGGMTAMVMGNTAERVLDKVDCSVIAVKPEGFQSPIHAPGR